MADTSSKDVARKRAQNHFTASEQRDSLVKQMIESERLATEVKTAKLRALRLAKEEADRQAALAAPPAPAPAKKTKARRVTVR
ncbi:MAG: hypothetical protein WDM89_13755 [Rhizomicrobium sp.]